MRRIIEREYQIGGVSCIDRTITDDAPPPSLWCRAAAIMMAAELVLMLGLVALAVAHRHGWL